MDGHRCRVTPIITAPRFRPGIRSVSGEGNTGRRTPRARESSTCACESRGRARLWIAYAVLQQVEARAAASVTRTAEEIDAIAQRARELLEQHHLSLWSFYSITAANTRQLSVWDARISLAYEVEHAPAEDIHDTLLHEIAHALVGRHIITTTTCGAPKRSPLAVQDAGVMICSSPRPANVRCERGCWIATAERRKGNVVCKRCRDSLIYQTYTEER